LFPDAYAAVRFSEVGNNNDANPDKCAVVDCYQIREFRFEDHIKADPNILSDAHSARLV